VNNIQIFVICFIVNINIIQGAGRGVILIRTDHFCQAEHKNQRVTIKMQRRR